MPDPILIDLPAAIITERLLLRPPQAGDGPVMFTAVSESLPELRRFLASLPWVAAEQTIEASEVYCRTAQSNFLSRKDLSFLIFEKGSGELAGACGLHRTVWETPKTEIGYWCRTSRSGHGLISEAVKALVNYAFRHLGAVRIDIVTDEENHASRKVAERCGFELEAVLRHERRAPDGLLRNTCLYARFPAEPASA
jgi:RimJ/RimL family protein N-acetyltransferase